VTIANDRLQIAQRTSEVALKLDHQSEHETGDPLDGLNPEASRHPQSLYKMLCEQAPALRKDGVGVIVSRQEDVANLLRRPELFSSGDGAARLGNKRPLIPLQIDPPDHQKFRKLLDPLFSPQRVTDLEEPVARTVNELIDSFTNDRIDFVTQFSLPFSSSVFLTLLGLPLSELPRLLEMKDGIIRPHIKLGTSVRHPDADAYRERTGELIYDYFETALDERSPGHTDLLSRFLGAEVDGNRLSREEILDICFLFLVAGLDTVSAALDCFFRYLAENPSRRAELVTDPSIIPAVVEELLRWETPVMMVPRVATQDTELAGCPISAGETVLAMIGSANTDEQHCPDAHEVRWNRPKNSHIAFGGGVHRCLGSHLARLELRVALREWHARIPDYAIDPGAELVHTAGVRSLETFPMILGVSS
jgi:cytochrome P450